MPPTPEEIEKQTAEMVEFYTKKISFLKLQHEFEELAASIEEARLRRESAIYKQAQLQSAIEEAVKKSQEKEEMKLKKV